MYFLFYSEPKSKNSISVIKLNPIAKQDNDKTEPSSIRNS
jgi:hypothetical protein